MGRNGSGKSSLLWALQGSGRRQGRPRPGRRPATRRPSVAVGARRLVGLVPQTPADLLNLDTVAAELDQADHDATTWPASADASVARTDRA